MICHGAQDRKKRLKIIFEVNFICLALSMKDYYKILGVSPSSTSAEIKKSYRLLAFKYHPDKNPDNSLAEAHFKELQEAYETLSNARKRMAYDDERWLMGMGSKTQYKEAVTPNWLAKIARELNASLALMDTHRMSQRALQAYILLILTDSHLGVLQQHGDKDVNHTITIEILKASTKLEVRYLDPIEQRLVVLADGDTAILDAIYTTMDARIRKARQEKLLPYIVFAITLILCICMYFYAGIR
jgi:molecular chaperone DnaJ